MPPSDDWLIPAELRPEQADFSYDLAEALACVVGLRAIIPEDAFTAEALGTERLGHGVAIRADGLILTIGYLITEAREIRLTTSRGRAVPGHAVAYDYVSGFGLVQALGPLDGPAMSLGTSQRAALGDAVVVGAAGGPLLFPRRADRREAGVRGLLGVPHR